MFIGHVGLAFAAKRVAPNTSFGTLLAATQFADFLWPILLLPGIERVRIVPGITAVTPLDFSYYPWSHSLLMDLLWGTGLGALYYVFRHSRRGAWILAAGVVSHWVLDWISHRPDMPLYPGAHKFYGLGLWYSRTATIAVELPLYVLGLFLYLRATRSRDLVGIYSLWSFVLLLLTIWISSLPGAPPPSEGALKAMALSGLLLIPWAYWIERHRQAAAAMPAGNSSPATAGIQETRSKPASF